MKKLRELWAKLVGPPTPEQERTPGLSTTVDPGPPPGNPSNQPFHQTPGLGPTPGVNPPEEPKP